MLSELKQTRVRRERRSMRVRNTLARADRPRLTVFRSLKHIYAQIIDDQEGVTLVGVGTYDKAFQGIKDRKEAAKKVGLKLAELAKQKEIETIVFDRGRYKFHGRLAALAEGAREGGLSF